MAVVSLPLTFTNSFWTQDYRNGLEVLFSKLEQGIAENDEIVAFIRARANAENQLATSLLNPPAIGSQAAGFNRDDGASLLIAFRGLQAESTAQGQIHRNIAKDLQTLVAEPFDAWAQGYKERLFASKANALNNWIRSYEDSQKEVIKFKNTYLSKTRRADEAEDGAKFAPNSELGDHYTTSPRLAPRDPRTPQRSVTVSERIAQRFKEIQRKAIEATGSAALAEAATEATEKKEEEPPKVDKGKAKEVEPVSPVLAMSPPPMSPPLPPSKADVASPTAPASTTPLPPTPILLAGLSLTPSAVSNFLARAAAEMPLRPIRFPLLGEYPDCFSGAELVEWLNKNVAGFGGSIDLAEEAARDLTERDGLLRRVGEFGNQFEHADDAYYQFRPKAFDLEGKSTDSSMTAAKRNQIADNLLKRSNNFVSVVTKALNANSQNEPVHIRLRQEADEADKLYRVSVRKLDRQRLGLEERIEGMLKTLQRWELERLAAVKTVLLQFQGTLANLPKAFEPTFEKSSTLIASYQPESDLAALIERYRTGPFRPVPQFYESVAHDESDVVFGVDLRKWAEGGWDALISGEEKKEIIPPVLTALLDGMNEAYTRLPDDVEKRKSWIYDVPLPALHHLREALNAVPPGQPFSSEMLVKYDPPVISGCIKLWALELDPPLALWEGWDEIRKLYPTVGSVAKAEGETSEEQHLQDLQAALQRLPRVHLYVLDAIVSHIRNLIASTSADEPDDVYMSKLALSIGRTIIRPKVETELSIQDRHPTLLFLDLLKNYESILPLTIAKKQRESERRVPVRKRTAPVDMRMSRSRISVGAPTREILAAQQAAMKQAASQQEAPVPSPAVNPEEPKVITAKSVSIEAPAPVETVPAVQQDDTTPPRPTFKEPPPEMDDVPPRPSFKEPPPEIDDVPHAQPTFVSPPASPPPAAEEKPVSPAVAVNPATPQNPIKSLRRNSALRSGNASPARSPSPSIAGGAGVESPAEDQPLTSGKSGLSRHTSGQGQGGAVRGPRLSRGPRVQQGSGVSGMIANFNNRASAASPPPSPGHKRLSSGVPARPTSMLAGSGAGDSKRGLGRSSGGLSRRTMASDAEDEVVDK